MLSDALSLSSGLLYYNQNHHSNWNSIFLVYCNSNNDNITGIVTRLLPQARSYHWPPPLTRQEAVLLKRLTKQMIKLFCCHRHQPLQTLFWKNISLPLLLPIIHCWLLPLATQETAFVKRLTEQTIELFQILTFPPSFIFLLLQHCLDCYCHWIILVIDHMISMTSL